MIIGCFYFSPCNLGNNERIFLILPGIKGEVEIVLSGEEDSVFLLPPPKVTFLLRSRLTQELFLKLSFQRRLVFGLCSLEV